jgi:alkaline phosphatase D
MASAIRATVSALLIGVCIAATTEAKSEGSDAVLTHGVAVGDVSPTRAVIWGRCSAPATMHARVAATNGTSDAASSGDTAAAQDLTAKIAFEGLRPGTTYTYRSWCGANETAAVQGGFSTAPDAGVESSVRFVWGGDVGGQNACRDREAGYAVFDTIAAMSPAFFIGLGDLIYADDPCKPVGRYGNAQIPGPAAPATTRPMFWEYWKYNRADAAQQRLLAAVPIYPVWDDHEVTNDAGPYSQALRPALQAFFDYQPLLPPAETPTRMFRTVRWGKLLEVFILDLRQYRDANRARDSTEKPKSMLGADQRRWFLERLRQSDATWKIIVSSVPLSIPTGSAEMGHDGWTGYGTGDGFENERRSLLEAMSHTEPRNYVWITTDVHFGAAFRYRPIAGDPQFVLHELISGPLNAGVFSQEAYDKTLGTERLFKYGPPTAESIKNFEEARNWFNFGVVDIDKLGKLTARLINSHGRSVYELLLEPAEASRRATRD